MQAWRLCRAAFADLSGQGARMAGGRWNSPGLAAVYLADHPALCVLEVRVHLDLPLGDLPADYVLLRVDLADASIATVDALPAEPRQTGDDWIAAGRSALLRVRSVLVPHCTNFIMNPAHPASAAITVTGTTPYRFDRGLW